MSLSHHLSAMPLWLSFPLVVFLPTALVVSALIGLRDHTALKRLKTNDEAANFTFATISVIYAVLLGFAVIVVWEKYREAESAVMKEAGAAAALYRLSYGLDGYSGASLRGKLTAYMKSLVTEDWAEMNRGGNSENTTAALSDLYGAATAAQVPGNREAAVLMEIIEQLNLVTQARRDCNNLAAGIVPSVIWTVLVAGGIMTVGSAFFFTSENLFAQAVMTGMLCVIVCLALMVIVSISHPFSGPVSVGPEPLTELLRDFGH
jgi:putative Mn2+ efflux pump MntP